MTKSRGILNRKPPTMFGDRYGSLLVIGEGSHTEDYRGNVMYIAKVVCICGAQFEVRLKSLRDGNTKSCGCGRSDAMPKGIFHHHHSHGMSKTSTYRIWAGMKKRCMNPKTVGYENWGGRGIKVCDRWMKFENFLSDMGERPDGLSLDRIDFNGDYEPDNCRWADRATQGFNTRRVIQISINGQIMSMHQAVKLLNVNVSSVREYAERRGWTYQEAVTFYAMRMKEGIKPRAA